MIHIGQLIEMELHRQERSVTWFANKLYCDRTNVYSIFKRKSIDTELLLRISYILNHTVLYIYFQQHILTLYVLQTIFASEIKQNYRYAKH